MQEGWVWSSIQEDPTCCGTTNLNILQLLSLCSRAQEQKLLSPCTTTTEACAPWSPYSATREATAMKSSWLQLESRYHLLQLEKSPCSEAPTQPKINKIIKRERRLRSNFNMIKFKLKKLEYKEYFITLNVLLTIKIKLTVIINKTSIS